MSVDPAALAVSLWGWVLVLEWDLALAAECRGKRRLYRAATQRM